MLWCCVLRLLYSQSFPLVQIPLLSLNTCLNMHLLMCFGAGGQHLSFYNSISMNLKYLHGIDNNVSFFVPAPLTCTNHLELQLKTFPLMITKSPHVEWAASPCLELGVG